MMGAPEANLSTLPKPIEHTPGPRPPRPVRNTERMPSRGAGAGPLCDDEVDPLSVAVAA